MDANAGADFMNRRAFLAMLAAVPLAGTKRGESVRVFCTWNFKVIDADGIRTFVQSDEFRGALLKCIRRDART
jgi:hypothetical protein